MVSFTNTTARPITIPLGGRDKAGNPRVASVGPNETFELDDADGTIRNSAAVRGAEIAGTLKITGGGKPKAGPRTAGLQKTESRVKARED